MGKKKKEKGKVIEKFPIEAEIANFESKYPSILPYIDPNLIRRLYETSIPKDSRENGVSWNITANFTVEKKFFLALKELIIDGDIDLEIAVVEQFMPIGRMLIRKLGYKESDIDNKVETAITEAIENYTGQDGFKSCILQELKDMIRGKEKKVSVTLEEPKKVELEEKTVSILESKTIEEPVKEEQWIVPTDGKLRPPTTLDQLLFQIDILNNSPLEDDTYIKFLSLKYGYHYNQFFSLEEISQILSISLEKTRDYYLQSLQFVKDWFGLQLDKYYTYLKEKAND